MAFRPDVIRPTVPAAAPAKAAAPLPSQAAPVVGSDRAFALELVALIEATPAAKAQLDFGVGLGERYDRYAQELRRTAALPAPETPTQAAMDALVEAPKAAAVEAPKPVPAVARPPLVRRPGVPLRPTVVAAPEPVVLHPAEEDDLGDADAAYRADAPDEAAVREAKEAAIEGRALDAALAKHDRSDGWSEPFKTTPPSAALETGPVRGLKAPYAPLVREPPTPLTPEEIAANKASSDELPEWLR